jgi:hypothetical protein
MRWLVLLILLLPLMGGCPAPERAEREVNAAPSAESQLESGSEAELAAARQLAVDFLLASLEDPVSNGNAPLGPVWEITARLNGPADFKEAILRQVADAKDKPPQELAAAWLAYEPDKATQLILEKLKEGRFDFLASLYHAPAAGIDLLAQLELESSNAPFAISTFALIDSWGIESVPTDELVKSLALHEDFRIRLMATGELIARGLASDMQVDEVLEALSSGNLDELSAAAEAVKRSADGKLAGHLVPLVAQHELGEVAEQADKDVKALYVAYALTYLPGEQAAHMRKRLLGSVDPAIRWQARLGQLLYGDPGFWENAVTEQGVDLEEMWIALSPASTWHADLLPTLKKAAGSENPQTRLRAAQQLNRYGSLPSNSMLAEMADRLLPDLEPEVKAATWRAAAELCLPGFTSRATAVLKGADEQPLVRLAAAHYLLAASSSDEGAD